MIKLTIYNFLCLTLSVLVINVTVASLGTLDADALTCIFKHLDPIAYEKMILNKVDGDILFISPNEQRTAENTFCFVTAKITHFRSLICVNKYLNTVVTTFFKNNQPLILSKKLLYEEPIKSFIKIREIIFFNIKGVHENVPVNIVAELRCRNMFESKSYEFAVSMDSANGSNIDLPYFDNEKPLENISLMLFACIKNKESVENNAYVQTLVKDITSLLNGSSKTIYINTFNNGDGRKSYGFSGNAVLLRIMRDKDDKINWNIFPINLFCKLIDFKNKFETNN